MRFILTAISIVVFSSLSSAQSADTCKRKRFDLHFQTTYIYQYKPAFNAPYSGANSLGGRDDHENSLTSTLYLGAALWKGAEVYVNPELAGGSGLSGALGMAGSSNGETFRVGNPAPSLYLARGYFRQTIALSKSRECVEDEANQLSGPTPEDYLRFYIGKFSIGDLFDNNEYSNSPREQFLNWSLMNNGAWDYSANVRGYTYAFATELQMAEMNYKVSLSTLPLTANGAKMNTNISEALAVNAEITRNIKLAGRPGHIRVLGYYNRANMGNYKLAMSSSIDTPVIETTRVYSRSKAGFGINIDQELSDAVGFFARIGWNDGKNETWCFTEIDRSVSLGIALDGKAWKRDVDKGGIAVVLNGLSKDHSHYLARGGNGFILGDGALNYAPEFVTELYYNYKPTKFPIWVTGDYQFCLNPGYNKDRGPVNIFSLRLHVEI